MFSSRVPHDPQTNPLMAELEARRRNGDPLLDLTETNPTQVGLRYDAEAILAAWSRPEALIYEPSPRGLRTAREAVAAYYADHGRAIDPDSLFLTASTSEAYAFAFKLLGNPGDQVLMPEPSYPLFEQLVALEGLVPVSYRLEQDGAGGWRPDEASLRAAWGPRARAVVAVSPNNPTGSYLAPADRALLSKLCVERGAAFLVDEVFLDYPSRDWAGRADTAAGNDAALTLVLSGLSKVAALPQAKLGWIQVSGPADPAREACARLELIADTYLSVGTAIQHGAPELLARRGAIQDCLRERLETNARTLAAACAGGPLVPLPREGGWYGVLRLPRGWTDDETALRLLREEGVLVHPGYFYDFADEDLIVLSLICAPEVFAKGVDRITALGARGQGRAR